MPLHHHDYQPGDLIRCAADYKTEQVLGSGGMATVYRARHCELYRSFAIKVMHAEHCYSPVLVDMFGREARTGARLGEPQPHPGIIEILDLGRTKDRGRAPYLVMPYLSGETLHACLLRHRREGKTMPILQAIGIVTRLCQALDHAHERGVIHRDVKPENVFLPQLLDGQEIKVLDWGISKLLQHADNPRTFIGTPSYAAPEQMLGQGIGPPADVYSSGVVLFRCLTGILPFAQFGMKFEELIPAIRVTAPRIRTLGEFPPALDDLVASALDKDPANRPDAMTMARVLQEIGAAIRGARDPHGHVTDQVTRSAGARAGARPEPVTDFGIAAPTFEDPTAQRWAEAQRAEWEAKGLIVRDAEGALIYNAVPQEPSIIELAPTEERKETKTKAKPSHIVHRTEPMAKPAVSRETATNVRGLSAAPDGPPPSVEYVTQEERAIAAKLRAGHRVNVTQPMQTALRRADGGDTPKPVIIPGTPSDVADSPLPMVGFFAVLRARSRWLFGSTTWKENGRPLMATGVGVVVLVIVVSRLLALWNNAPPGTALASAPGASASSVTEPPVAVSAPGASASEAVATAAVAPASVPSGVPASSTATVPVSSVATPASASISNAAALRPPASSRPPARRAPAAPPLPSGKPEDLFRSF